MRSRHAQAVSLAALAYLALTAVYFWPLPIRLHGVAHDAGDPILNAWILWWTTKAVPLTAHWWNAPIFFPSPGTFAFSEHLLGLAPLAALLIAITHSVLFGYNVTLLAISVFSALGGYFLGYTLTRRHDAAFVSGLAFAYAPYRVGQLAHIQVLSSFWSPVSLAALHRYDRDSRLRWAVLAAGAWLMQALCCGYYLFFLPVLLVMWFAWFAAGRWPVARIAKAAACSAVAAALLAPLLAGYHDILVGEYGFHRNLETIQSYSANVAGLLDASGDLLLWRWVHVFWRPEGELFPGPTIVVLAVAGMTAARPFARGAETPGARWTRRVLAATVVLCLIGAALPIVYGTWRLRIGGLRLLSIARTDKAVTLAVLAGFAWIGTLPAVAIAERRRSPLVFYIFAAFAMWVFSLGPDPMLFDSRVLYQAPYGWLMRLPGFDGLRVPARFWMMALVCLSAVAALAVNRASGRARRIVVSLAAIGLLLDGWPRGFNVAAEPERRAAPAGVVARVALPMTDEQDALALYQQTRDGVPLYNGFSGYDAPQQYALREALASRDPAILQALTTRGALGVVIDHDSDAGGAVRRFVSAFPGAVLHETHASWSSYRLPAHNGGDLLPDRSGEPLRIKSLDAFPSAPHTPRALDGRMNTRWSGGVQRSAADFTIELEQSEHVGQLVTDLGEFWTDFPRRLRVTVSADGSRWDTVYVGDTALHAYYGALRHPKEIPLVFTVGRDNVRFIRLEQLGWGPHDWSIAEVHVLR